MNPTRLRTLSRSILTAVTAFLLLTAVSCDSPAPPQETQVPAAKSTRVAVRGTIVAVGDSLTDGLGVDPDESYPALLERLLGERGLPYRVVNAGISGETSSGARARIDWMLKLKPQIVILETGANDGLRGIAPELVENNIEQILIRLEREGVTAVLVGMMMVTNLGKTYVDEFNAIYPRLADRHGVVFMPFFLKDVAAEPSKNQEDGIHPNAAGYEIIAANLLPYVEEAIRRHEQGARQGAREPVSADMPGRRADPADR